jgi:hypothetical protein
VRLETLRHGAQVHGVLDVVVIVGHHLSVYGLLESI